MPWYRTGTVAITAGQNTVTGTGTNFSANGRVGDAFLGPDGRWYEVTNIASGTVLSILPAYQGATVTGGTYAITPVQGYTKTLADKFNDIANTWGSTLAGLGSVSTENVVPVNKGGTGGNTPALARSGLGLGAAAVAALVGTVTQGGSAVFERGSNANGDYIKFADGTMICTSVNRALEFANSSNLRTVWSYPALFAAVPVVLVNQNGSSIPFNKAINGCYAYSRNGSVATCSITSLGSFVTSDATAATLDTMAIGRWFV